MTTRTETAKATVSTSKIVSERGNGCRCNARLTGFKAKSHGLTNDPSDNNKERSDTEGNLNTRSNGNSHGKVHLVTNRNHDSRNVLSRVSDNGNQDKTNEGLADVALFNNVINTANQVVCADGNQAGDGDENQASSNGTQMGFVTFFLFFVGLGLLGIEKVAVGAELEDEVHDIEHEKDDGGTAGEGEDAIGLFVRSILVKNAIQLLKCQHSSWVTCNGWGSGNKLTAAGRTREAEERVIKEQVVWATAAEKLCSVPAPFWPRWRRPPNKKHIPITRSKLERMEPSIEDWTT